jgi:trans-2,3-dihydro-3-hydroxyanthranilate isomerase
MTKSYPFYQVDAFTETKLGGNPCAVFLNADDMSDATMLAVAKEVRQSNYIALVNDRVSFYLY